jgi:GDP-4-dehydro-6-deoxy-D-mannose reductase
VPILWADPTKFRKATGWEPKIPFEQTLHDVLDYWRERVAAEGGQQSARGGLTHA